MVYFLSLDINKSVETLDFPAHKKDGSEQLTELLKAENDQKYEIHKTEMFK